MGFDLPFILALFTVTAVVNHAALTPELYWKKVLPGTSMPKPIRDVLYPEFVQSKSSSVTVEKGNRVDISQYTYSALGIENPFKDDINEALYFLEADLVPGKTFSLQLTKATGTAAFLPREMADLIPFSSQNITNILDRFSINPESKDASIMRETITACEAPAISGEQKYCATSLESMIDFSMKILGKKEVKAVSTESNEDTHIKKYKIEGNINSLTGDKEINALSVVCHKLNYVYAVFYCHSLTSTKVYMVSLKGEDGTEVKAIANCHEDTSKWNPKHLSFRMTKVKPGTVPICHFLTDNNVVWYQN